MNKEQYKGVMVFAEQREGVIQNVAYELIGKARELAEALGEKSQHFCVVIMLQTKQRG